MWEPADRLTMTPDQRCALEIWTHTSGVPARQALRARICLLANEGVSNRQIATRLNCSRPTVLLWRQRFVEGGPAGLEHDAPRGPSSRRLPSARVAFIAQASRDGRQLNGWRWTTRALAKRLHVSHTSVARIWAMHGLQPHRDKLRRRYRKPAAEIIQPLADVVGLYLNPPERALVFCVHDLQIYDRIRDQSQAAGCHCSAPAHDHVQAGPAALLAALSAAENQVLGGCFQQPRHLAFLDFLRKLDRQTSREATLHLVIEDSPTLHHELVKNWLANRARFHVHVTPAGASWLEQARQVFAEISKLGLRQHSYWSAAPLADVVQQHALEHKNACAPLVWTSPSMLLKTYVGAVGVLAD